MISAIQTISFFDLSFAFIPVMAVVFILWKWNLGIKSSLYALARMLIQLLLIGFVLAYIFKADDSIIVISVLVVMLFAASLIALRTVKIPLKKLFLKSFASIFIGGLVILIIVTQFVLDLDKWYEPSYVVPLAGMIFANSMNAVSLAGERVESELSKSDNFTYARNAAFKASLIPITNSLLAVGLVSLPGMMTGQILSGVSPFIAARYQIMVMCMIFSASGLSSALFLHFSKVDFISREVQ